MNPALKRKRVTVKLKHPNPLFEKWLTEWKLEAQAKDSQQQHAFNKALKSLQRFPLPLERGRDCKVLKGFGDRICMLLDRKLAEYKAKNGPLPQQQPAQPIATTAVNARGTTLAKATDKVTTPKKSRSKGQYTPGLRTGPYGILMALIERSREKEYPGFLLKEEIVKFGQPYCDKSFTKPDVGTRYTAWSSMKTLVNKDLVIKTQKGRTGQFSLSDTGRKLAIQLYRDLGKCISDDDNTPEEIINNEPDLDDGPSTSTYRNKPQRTPEIENISDENIELINDMKTDEIPYEHYDFEEMNQILREKLADVSTSTPHTDHQLNQSNLTPGFEKDYISDDDLDSINERIRVMESNHKHMSPPLPSEDSIELNLAPNRNPPGFEKAYISDDDLDSINEQIQFMESNQKPMLASPPPKDSVDLSPSANQNMNPVSPVASIDSEIEILSDNEPNEIEAKVSHAVVSNVFEDSYLSDIDDVNKLTDKVDINRTPGFENDYLSDDDLETINERIKLAESKSAAVVDVSAPSSSKTITSASRNLLTSFKSPGFENDYVSSDEDLEKITQRFNEIRNCEENGVNILEAQNTSDSPDVVCLDEDSIEEPQIYSANNLKTTIRDKSSDLEISLDHDLQSIMNKYGSPLKAKPPEANTVKIPSKNNDYKSSGRSDNIIPESTANIDTNWMDDIPCSYQGIQHKYVLNDRRRSRSANDVLYEIPAKRRMLSPKKPSIEKSLSEKLPAVVEQTDPDSLKVQQKMPTQKNLAKLNQVNKDSFDDIVLLPNQFDIILLVDKQEVSGKNVINEPTHIELNRNNVLFEIRKLNIGDFCWIARCKINPTVELVLPYVIERKRMDDFGSSIKDGRFHEQKFRLRQCGIENLIYLVENYGTNQHCGLPLSTLQQAATNTKIQDKFIVKYTECLAHSVSYISTFTQVITNLYQKKTLTGCSKENLIGVDITEDHVPLMTFAEFNKSSSKSKGLTIRELFMRQLVKIKGISVDKAMAITEQYPTPLRLRIAILKQPINDTFLSNLQYGFGKQKRYLGAALSKTIYQLYSKKTL